MPVSCVIDLLTFDRYEPDLLKGLKEKTPRIPQITRIKARPLNYHFESVESVAFFS